MTTAAMSESPARTPATPAIPPGAKDRVWLNESLAPAVDTQLLVALVRRELPEPKARDVYRFIHLFASWNDAYTKALIVEQQRSGQG